MGTNDAELNQARLEFGKALIDSDGRMREREAHQDKSGTVTNVPPMAIPVEGGLAAMTKPPLASLVRNENQPVSPLAKLVELPSWKYWSSVRLSAPFLIVLAGMLGGRVAFLLVTVFSAIAGIEIKYWLKHRGKGAAYTPTASPEVPPVDTAFKKCPFCAEEIRADAILCRFCQKEQPAGALTPVHPSHSEAHPHSSAANQPGTQSVGQAVGGLISLAFFVWLAWHFNFVGIFGGGNDGVGLFGSTPVPHITFEPPLSMIEDYGIQFSDWRWDQFELLGKVTFNPPKDRAPFIGPLSLLHTTFSSYGKDGTKLKDGMVFGPDISPGETARVKIVTDFSNRDKIAKIVIHMKPRFPALQR